MLVYKPIQHLKQKTGLNYPTNVEMIHLKFSLTSQCHKITILRFVFKNAKVNCGLVSSNNQSIQTRKLGVKTARPV